MTETEFHLASMTSGECRYVHDGHEDVQAYCRRPFVETLMPSGRMGWTPGPASYSIVCPDAGLEYGNWLPLEQAAALVDRIVAGALPAAA